MGLRPWQRFESLIIGSLFIIEITDRAAVKLERCLYAFLVGDVILRIGSSKAPLIKRLRSWELHVTHALNGRKSSIPDWEAAAWNEELSTHGKGVIYARQGASVTTSVGKFDAYLDEESVLIGRHLPRLNRRKHR